MGFKDKLKEKLKANLTDEELSVLPSGFQTIGKIMIIKLNPLLIEKRNLIGKACLELNPYIKSVYINLGKVTGTFREPEKIELIAGVEDPITEHKEHGVIYRFNVKKIMFSKGNINERKFLATLVSDNEIIVDMFAGIGYFSLPIAKHAHPKQIYSIELNPFSYNFFVENIKINHLQKIITPILGDSKEEVLKLSECGIRADRVIMGIFPAPKEYIREALTLTKTKGTIFHYEGVVEKQEYVNLYNEFNHIAKDNGFTCELLSHRFVKSYGPNIYHVVLDIKVSRNEE
ncbi:MAG: class I SAM-dependent methyltransferase family protein [Promethearchaeota archaeon]|nr:MAG: class I SAM-dependent methyltransferase family protein [Candidatus Lokiarchaeota archaeon]